MDVQSLYRDTSVGRAPSKTRARPVSSHEPRTMRETVVPFEPIRAADATTPTKIAIEVVPRPRSERLNRLVNIFIAGAALVLLSPLLLLIALVVKLTSRGPVLYAQPRVGIDRRSNGATALHDHRVRDLGGQIFKIYKFRSMRLDAEYNSGAVWATKDDPRATPVGRVLRKFRLDELPQLFNVLNGEMNIVGPRPERPSIFARLRVNITEYPMRQRARPGITGWAQINHTYDVSLDDVRTKVEYDLEYLQQQSFYLDFKIMLKTIPVVLFRRSGW